MMVDTGEKGDMQKERRITNNSMEKRKKYKDCNANGRKKNKDKKK